MAEASVAINYSFVLAQTSDTCAACAPKFALLEHAWHVTIHVLLAYVLLGVALSLDTRMPGGMLARFAFRYVIG